MVPSKPKKRKDQVTWSSCRVSHFCTEVYLCQSKPITLRQEKLAAELAFTSRSPSPDADVPKSLTHVQEQKKLRDETVAAFHIAVSGDASDEDDLLVPREKTKDELQREEEEYREFLHREVGEDLHGLITVDEDTIGIHENEKSGRGDGNGRKKKKDKGKEKETGWPEAKGEKEKGDQEFLMRYVPPEIPRTPLRNWSFLPVATS